MLNVHHFYSHTVSFTKKIPSVIIIVSNQNASWYSLIIGVLGYCESTRNNHICRGSDCRIIIRERNYMSSNKNTLTEEPEETFGKVLRKNMRKQGIEVKHLSERTGISIPSIYRYLNGERICGLEHTAAICIAMRLHPMISEYLFSMTRSHLCRTDERDIIIAKYLYGCYYDTGYTLRKCNHEMIYEGYEPRTSFGTAREYE